ncbi:MAG: hypothetical protein AAGD28_20690 [Bacteroidota bacterium]
MTADLPLVYYHHKDPLSITLFNDLILEVKPQFRLKFLSSEENLVMRLLKEKRRPKIILIEQEYNRESPYQLLWELKSDPSSKDIPIILLAKDVQTGQAQSAIDLGAFSVLEKPSNSEFMRTIIELINILIM